MVIRCRQRGFTLLEILVALAILALSMGAIIKASGDFTGNHAWLRDRTLATWVARNVLVGFQLENAWPSVGEQKGTQEMGRREWRWVARVSQTDEPKLRRLDVEVYLTETDEEEPVTVLSGFLKQVGK